MKLQLRHCLGKVALSKFFLGKGSVSKASDRGNISTVVLCPQWLKSSEITWRGECKEHFRMWSCVPETLWTIFCSASVPHGTLIRDREGYEGHLLILGFLPFSSCAFSSSCIQFIFEVPPVADVNGWMFLTFSLYKDQIRCALFICHWFFFSSKVF